MTTFTWPKVFNILKQVQKPGRKKSLKFPFQFPWENHRKFTRKIKMKFPSIPKIPIMHTRKFPTLPLKFSKQKSSASLQNFWRFPRKLCLKKNKLNFPHQKINPSPTQKNGTSRAFAPCAITGTFVHASGSWCSWRSPTEIRLTTSVPMSVLFVGFLRWGVQGEGGNWNPKPHFSLSRPEPWDKKFKLYFSY